MEFTDRIFHYVQHHYPSIWKKIINITRLHKLSSIKKIFNEHLKYVDDIEIFNIHKKRVGIFLLKFCEAIQRNFLCPGDSYGVLVTTRFTSIYTQDTLDKRHLKDLKSDFININYSANKDLNFELNIYTTLNQIFEITNKRKFTTLFLKNYTVEELLKINSSETCYLNLNDLNNSLYNEQLILKNYIITPSFIPTYLKIIQKSEHRNYLFRHLNQSNIIAFTDLKCVYKKCGLICYFFNLIEIVKLQFFKKTILESKHERDMINILIYQVYNGVLLPLNRNGLKKNENRPGLDKLCFEAVKQIYVHESLKNVEYPVKTCISRMCYGQQFPVGTGYDDFALYPCNVLNK